MAVITRFAPSPTGHLHIGGVRTALFCWALARQTERGGGAGAGRFLLRIEDTDQARSSEAAARGLLEDLAWLGLEWDEGPEFAVASDGAGMGGPGMGGAGRRVIGGDDRGVGPFYQAQRLDHYARFTERLIEQDLAYPAFETAEELGRVREAAQQRKENFRYRRTDDYDRDAALARMAGGEPCIIRFRSPPEAITVADLVLGDVTIAAEEQDDFVIRKADGYPTYHFAVVVDDELMEVTHILRGQEHLINTPRHVALQRALGFRTPQYAHLPLIFNPDGSKMSKRDKDKAVRARCKELGIDSYESLQGWLERAAAPGDLGLWYAEQVMVGADLSLDRLNEKFKRAYVALHSLIGPAVFDAWLKDKSRQLPSDVTRELAGALGVELPEIDVEDFRRSGYLPSVVLNYLALLGWNPGEKDAEGRDVERFDLDYLVEKFGLERIGKSASKFDRDKLLSFNADDIQKMSDEAFLEAWRPWLARYAPDLLGRFDEARLALYVAAIRPRCRTLAEAASPSGPGGFVLAADDAIAYDEKAADKFLRKGDPSGLSLLPELRDVLAAVEPFEPEAIEAAISAWCESKGVGTGKAAQPLRVALTGSSASPGLGQTVALVGREGAVRRIERVMAVLR
jgi:glutamyl/glutaminyl-tRNA synthetase